MSGHTNFTSWIDADAGYVLIEGRKEIIISTFFTSDDMPNSDIFNIKTNKGCYSLGDKRLAYSDLSERHSNNYK